MNYAFFTIAALLAVPCLSAPALGHGQFTASAPPCGAILPVAPTSISISVSETVASSSASIRVTDSAGKRVDANGTRVDSSDARTMRVDLVPLPDGVFTATWSMTSAVDGHFSAGSCSFGVGAATAPIPAATQTLPPSSPLEVAIRAATYGCTAALVGGLGFYAFVWRGAVAKMSRAGKAATRPTTALLLFWCAGQAVCLATFSTAWTAYAVLSAASAGTGASLDSSAFLLTLEVRVVAAVASACVLALALRLGKAEKPRVDPERLVYVGLGAALCVVGATSTASHSAAAVAWQPVGAAADFAHLLFVCLWVGGLFALALVRRSVSGMVSARLAKEVFRRFSRLAFYSVGVVLIAGLLLSLIQVGSVDRVTQTTYGLVIVAKASLFAPMVALGAHNHFRSIPLLRDPERLVEAALRMAGNARIEAVLGAGVLVLAGFLTTLSPAVPVLAAEQPFILQQSKDGLRVDLQLYPPPTVPTAYTASVLVWNATSGSEFENITSGALRFTLQNATQAPSDVPLEGPHGNHLFNDTTAMSSPGTWRVDVNLRRSDGFDVRVTFFVVIREP